MQFDGVKCLNLSRKNSELKKWSATTNEYTLVAELGWGEKWSST